MLSVYDTVFNDIDTPTMTLLNSMFEGDFTVTIVPLQNQQGGSDCGVFSIAIATSLLHGHSPGPYKQSLLRPHLISCFENNLMLPFPLVYTLVSLLLILYSITNYLLYIMYNDYFTNTG